MTLFYIENVYPILAIKKFLSNPSQRIIKSGTLYNPWVFWYTNGLHFFIIPLSSHSHNSSSL